MKFQSTIRNGFVLVGFAAFALLPASLNAQEITNAEFNDGPNVTSIAQPSPSQQTDVNAVFAMPPTEAMKASDSIAEFAGPQQAAVVIQWPEISTDSWIAGTLLAAVTLISLYALALAKRANRALKSARGTYVSNRTA